ncbi:uncharacterized protein LOC127366935 [Dicentrarchus labrax]|uniref:uncharacterized protein LOC127366935 n=1 Tax=Dicentrarchus labrax TaxID=13489 RepID=UPI0021F554AF|nr:uncharacterized protein LOC127366935 [Dicentrarchus labrax]
MASTPSASALSAVLRCRGNLWTRNPPTKRPATSVYSLGLAGGVVRDSPAERTLPDQASAWEAFLQGERVVVWRKLTLAFKSPCVDGKVRRQKKSRESNKLCHPKLSQSPGDAHSAVPGVQNALVRQLARGLTFNLPGVDECSKIIQMIKYKTYATYMHTHMQICKIGLVFVQEISESPAGVLKVSIPSPCVMEDAGQIPSFVLTGWSTLKSTCLSLTALVSELMFLKLGLLCRSSSSPKDAPQHLLSQQDEENIKDNALQENGQIDSSIGPISTQDNSGSRQRITKHRPA